ncbi:MAG: HEAT repeat domain-containing protein [Pirellulaceae bacterium]
MHGYGSSIALVARSGYRAHPAAFSRYGLVRLMRQDVMIRVLACVIMSGVTSGVLAAPRAAADPDLDAAFQILITLEPGQDLQLLNPVERAIIQSRSDATARADLEGRLIGVLQGSATDMAKDYACRQLPLIGSDACVAALAELLPNPRLSYMARYALEGLGSPAAIESLRGMLGKTQGRQQAGVIISLGTLGDDQSVVPIAAMLTSDNAELREAAMIALGRIGSVAAATALQEFASQAAENECTSLVDAQLAAVEALCRQGEHAAAVTICESLQMADSEQVRATAFRGLLAAKPAEALPLILAGLAAEESWKRAVAADALVPLQGAAELGVIAAAIPDLPPLGKIAAFVSLKDRRDPSLRVAALKALEDSDPGVQTAALTALIACATAEDIPQLIGLAATAGDPVVRDAACDTLRLMTAEGSNQRLLALLDDETDLCPIVLRAALARRSPTFVPAFLQAAESADPAVRQQAFLALEVMATPAEAESLIRLLCRSVAGEEREAADRAVWMSCQQIPDLAARWALLSAALAQADVAGKCALLPTVARLGGAEALAAVHEAMRSADPTVCEAGHRALANWPDDSVAGELLEIAKRGEVEAYRIWSLRAYARIVSLPSDRPAQTTFEMLRSVMDLATRDEDKELIISRMSAVRVPDALAQLLTYVDQPALKEAAVPALFTLAKGLSQSHPDQARAALEKIRTLTDDAVILQQIPKVLRDIEARKQ